MKTQLPLAIIIQLAAFIPFASVAQTTNLMPQGFAGVSFGMSSNQLHQARQNAEWRGSDLPSNEATEILQDRTFFDVVGYDFFPTGGLAAVYFRPVLNEATKRSVLPGFVKGCIAKYGTNYEQRVRSIPSQPPMKIPILRWTNDNAVIAAIFISDGNQKAFKDAGGRDMVPFPYRLLIYHKDAININGGTNYLNDVMQSVPSSQDTTGRAFTNFPAFLDSYNGTVWQ